jgi:hypothetical protein
MNQSDITPTRTVCGMKLDNGGHCQNPVKPGKGPCWRHADGFWRKVQSFARNETKKFVLTTAIGLAGIVWGGSRINITRTGGPNSPAVTELVNDAVVRNGSPDEPFGIHHSAVILVRRLELRQ